MKRRIFGLVLLCVLLCGTATTAYAADAEAYNAADVLYDLGLFSGTGTKADGTPNFDLDRTPTRHEAVTMLISLLGKKEEALSGTWETPFTDVVDWAKPFVGYAYANGLTSGTSATTYGGDTPLTAAQYFTFVLKALGYETGTDFQWDKSFEFAAQIGLTDNRYATTKDFLRGDVTTVSRNAMDVKLKGSGQTLAEKLMAENVFTTEAYKQTLSSPLVLQNPDKFDGHFPPVTFAINGKMQDYVGDYIAKAGTYIVTPYLYGERLGYEDYEIDYEGNYAPDDTGTVIKNNDGTLTVVYPGKEDFAFTIVYISGQEQVVTENGEISIIESHTKRSLGFAPAIPERGLAMRSGYCTFMPGKSFGDNFSPYHVIEDVYYNGVRIDDYTVTTENGAPFNATIQADGSLLIMRTGTGRAKFTISYRGEKATYEAIMWPMLG